MDKQQKMKKISELRSSIRPAKRALLATTKKRIKHLLAKKEESKDHIIQTKFEKEIKSARGTIGCLKALQTTEIIKFGLRTDIAELQAILQRGQADVNTRAMARLCSKKIVQNAFQEFKVHYPDWKKLSISEFKVGKGVKKSNQTDKNKKKNKDKKALKPRKNKDKEDKELSNDQDEVKVEKAPKKKAIAKEEVASSPVTKNEQSKVQSPKKVPSPKKAPSPKKPAENPDESKDAIKSSKPSKIKGKSSTSPVKLTPSPAKKLNKRKKVSDVLSNVSSTRESTGLSDKTPKKVKFDDELTKTQKNKSLPESTPKSELKPIIKKTPSETKQKIQKPTRGKNLPEQRRRNKLKL